MEEKSMVKGTIKDSTTWRFFKCQFFTSVINYNKICLCRDAQAFNDSKFTFQTNSSNKRMNRGRGTLSATLNNFSKILLKDHHSSGGSCEKITWLKWGIYYYYCYCYCFYHHYCYYCFYYYFHYHH